MRSPLFAAGFLLWATIGQAETTAELPILNVLTYDSFVSDWGPGPAIETAFEAECGCDLRFSGSGDGAALLARVQLEGAGTDADVVLGLDTSLTAAATATGLFAPQVIQGAQGLPVPYDDVTWKPYDWGWYAFVYNKTRLAMPPTSFEALAASDLKVVIQDPRSSTPGLGLVLWVKATYGDRSGAIWEALADNIVTVTPGWSEAYGLFLAGEADMVLSYTTSPAYHLIAEGDDTKAAAPFDEGHYLQVEVMAALAGSDEPKLASDFIAFMMSDTAQALLPTTNWMYPAATPKNGLPKGFETLIKPTTSLLLPPAKAEALRGPAVDEWRAALSR